MQYFIDNSGDLLRATQTTFIEAIAGLVIATVFSFLMMILCFYRPGLMEFILPLMVTSQVIPLIVLAPFFIILMGIGLASKIAMAAVISFFPIFVNFAHGYKSISSNIHELMHIYDASTGFKIRNVYFPLSASSILSGLKVSATLAVIGAIVAEFTGAETGLGKNLFLSAIRLEPEMMMSSLILSSILGGALFLIISLSERKLTSWTGDTL
jgi:NitT/TauT family transport system permease protein